MDFATAAAQNSYAELMLSGLALQKTDDQAVRHFSEMMLEHHTPAIRNLIQRLEGSDITVPVMPNSEQIEAVERLEGLSGEEFTQAYMQHQLEAHEEAVAVFEQGAESAEAEDLRSYAMLMLPIMRAHLGLRRWSPRAAASSGPKAPAARRVRSCGWGGAGRPGCPKAGLRIVDSTAVAELPLVAGLRPRVVG